ncbi:TonB-dependent receptor [Nonlabens tegetincola]|uniref:TonB-dependent receptor n=1 Tax=Nonlabens tegetincola TaxID=323273 RepID=A0A090QR21_9FLAO|nr:TonB-dependent receptor [Nonlabens tegetincola]GAK97916.1 TonB-dependent receptor [Nonlabens tegetincola]
MKQILFILLLFSVLKSIAQVNQAQVQPLDTVALKVTRIDKNPDQVTASFSRVRFRESALNQQQLSLQEYLNQLNGVFSLNANNYAQDLRISIRGFGARSAFGIRGIKLVVDGIPETTPDGQGQIDNLPLGIIDNIAVLRGSSSALYGNASGGVISVNTIDDFKKDFVEIGLTAGSYNMLQSQVTAGFKTEASRYVIHANQITTDGYRDQSGFENYLFNYRSFHDLSKNTQLNFQLNYANSPEAEDPGSLNAEAISTDRRQARDRNLLFETQEAVQQVKLGTSLEHQRGNWNFNGYGFYSYRDFEARLPFEFGGAIDLNRNYFGVGVNTTRVSKKEHLSFKQQLGIDYGYQNDARRRFENLEGERGTVTLDQNERFSGLGFFYLQDYEWKKWTVNAGVRYDINVLSVSDEFESDGINNDDITINQFSLNAGAAYKLNDKNQLYATVSNSYETPVLSELSANPEDDGGFNQNLEAQQALNFEIGYRGKYEKLNLNSTLFYTFTTDDIVPFELQDFPDRTFFRNAGSSERLGTEIAAQYRFNPTWSAGLTYNFSYFTYQDYELPNGDFSGNNLPAIPRHLAQLMITYTKNSFNITMSAQYRDQMFTNDANSTVEPEVIIGQLRGSYKFQLSGVSLTPFAGINNLFDQKYNDNIRINAFGGRYFEPAPGFNTYAGLRVRF